MLVTVSPSISVVVLGLLWAISCCGCRSFVCRWSTTRSLPPQPLKSCQLCHSFIGRHSPVLCFVGLILGLTLRMNGNRLLPLLAKATHPTPLDLSTALQLGRSPPLMRQTRRYVHALVLPCCSCFGARVQCTVTQALTATVWWTKGVGSVVLLSDPSCGC
jgi:hypothetical protein